MNSSPPPVRPPPRGVSEPAAAWAEVARLTPARVALGRSGVSLPTREVLRFGLAHARACDAVRVPLDLAALRQQLEQDGWPVLEVHSGAPDRHAYLARPDWGRRLHPDSRHALADGPSTEVDVVFVLSDGLSAVAVQRHGAVLMRALKSLLADLVIAPIILASQARVALADEVGELLRARVGVSLIGERPGLSSPDSLGLYLTAMPRVGRTDAERHCISNIHAAGLSCEDAAAALAGLIRLALASGCSGVAMKTGRKSLSPLLGKN